MMEDKYKGYIPLERCTKDGIYDARIDTHVGFGCTTDVVIELEDGKWTTDEEIDRIGIFDLDFWDTDRYHTICKLRE